MDPQKSAEFPGSKPLPPIGSSSSESQEVDKKSSDTEHSKQASDDRRSSSSSTAFDRQGEGSARPNIVRGFRPEPISDDDMDDCETPRVETRRKTYDGREIHFITLDTQTDWDWVEEVEHMGTGRTLGSAAAEKEEKDKTDTPKSLPSRQETGDDKTSADHYQYQMPYNDEYGIPILDLSSDTDDSSDDEISHKKIKDKRKFIPSVGPPNILQIKSHRRKMRELRRSGRTKTPGKSKASAERDSGQTEIPGESRVPAERDSEHTEIPGTSKASAERDSGHIESPGHSKALAENYAIITQSEQVRKAASEEFEKAPYEKVHRDSSEKFQKASPSVKGDDTTVPEDTLNSEDDLSTASMSDSESSSQSSFSLPGSRSSTPSPTGRRKAASPSGSRNTSLPTAHKKSRKHATPSRKKKASSRKREASSRKREAPSRKKEASSKKSEAPSRKSAVPSRVSVAPSRIGATSSRKSSSSRRGLKKQYQRESEKQEMSADDPQARMTEEEYEKDDQGVTHGMFSGACEFCNKPVKPFPTVEQQHMYPPESLYCCSDYQEFVEFVMLTNEEMEDDVQRKNKLINVKPHEHVGSKQERNAAKEKAVQRMRERELQRRQQEASGLQQNFFASAGTVSAAGFHKKPLHGLGNLTMKDMFGDEDKGAPAKAHGTKGASGTQGASGTHGLSGTQGDLGTQGPSGTQGASGTQGPSGTQGASGSYGLSGTLGTLETPGSSHDQLWAPESHDRANRPSGSQSTHGKAGSHSTHGGPRASKASGAQVQGQAQTASGEIIVIPPLGKPILGALYVNV